MSNCRSKQHNAVCPEFRIPCSMVHGAARTPSHSNVKCGHVVASHTTTTPLTLPHHSHHHRPSENSRIPRVVSLFVRWGEEPSTWQKGGHRRAQAVPMCERNLQNCNCIDVMMSVVLRSGHRAGCLALLRRTTHLCCFGMPGVALSVGAVGAGGD